MLAAHEIASSGLPHNLKQPRISNEISVNWLTCPDIWSGAWAAVAGSNRVGHMQVEFHFNFASPNAYLAHRVIPAIEARVGARFRSIPVLLGDLFKTIYNRPFSETQVGIRNKSAYERLEIERFIRRYRIDGFVPNPFFPVNTLQVMRGAVAAEVDGQLERYVKAVFHHMWEAPKILDEPDVLHDALAASGLDAAQ